MAAGVTRSGEAYSNSIGRWIEYRAYPTEEGLSLVFRDIDDRRRHDERLRFLAEASTLLSSSLDYETTLSNIAELAVPALASSCVIDLVGENGQLERVATVFDSGELSRLVDEMRRRNPITPETRHPALQGSRDGRVDLLSGDQRRGVAAGGRRPTRLAGAGATSQPDIVRVRCVARRAAAR